MTDENHVPTVIRGRCGTLAGYHAHVRRLEKACDSCSSAQREYLREWRAKRTPEDRAYKKRYDAARARALTRLGRKHRRELADYIEEELKK